MRKTEIVIFGKKSDIRIGAKAKLTEKDISIEDKIYTFYKIPYDGEGIELVIFLHLKDDGEIPSLVSDDNQPKNIFFKILSGVSKGSGDKIFAVHWGSLSLEKYKKKINKINLHLIDDEKGNIKVSYIGTRLKNYGGKVKHIVGEIIGLSGNPIEESAHAITFFYNKQKVVLDQALESDQIPGKTKEKVGEFITKVVSLEEKYEELKELLK